MRAKTNQSGFSAVELVIVLAVVGVLGFVGFSVYNRQQTKTTDTGTTQANNGQSAKANDVASAPNISSTSDLDKAATMLDQTDPSGSNNSDAGQLDSQTANF
jgi:prepilin-type N-terminal cleavage/methylation domain-containing protein